MSTDASLLERFVEEHSEAAFAELVHRHVDLVHSAALRQVAGDAHKAQDVTQAVFGELARKASGLVGHRCLAGWLYTTARHIASRLQRTEARRAARENASLAMKDSSTDPESEAIWHEIGPVLDEAMQELGEKDREAVILRYFQSKPLSEIGTALRLNENAARMRVERALEKLRRHLSRKGIKSSASLLGTALAANAVSTAPSSLAAVVVGPALAGAASAAPTMLSILHFMTVSQLKTTIAAVAILGTTTGLIVSHRTNHKLHEQVESLRVEASDVEQLRTDNKRLGQLEIDQAELDRLRGQSSELLRLRGEVGRLKQQLASIPTPALPQPTAPKVMETALTDEQRRETAKNLGMAKMTLTRVWGTALLAYAAANGKFPEQLAEVQDYLPAIPEEVNFLLGLSSPSDFELVFHGSLSDVKHPERTIIMREKEPFNFQEDGTASRTYLFADGHSEVHNARNGDFESWERQRLLVQQPVQQ